MSQDAPSNRKEKKAVRDAERHQKGKKRKHAETVEEPKAVPGDVDQDFISLATGDVATDTGEVAVKQPKSKKRKQREEDSIDAPQSAKDATAAAEQPPAKKKKRRKAKSTAAPTTNGATNGADGAPDNPNGYIPQKSRFIVFIGNLPYDTTDASLQSHFQKLYPFTLRHRTDPKTKKSKGFAFLEFENYDRMETCLKLYHHGMFAPADHAPAGKGMGKGKRKGGRRINVELTAGGGGKAENRKEKIREKNVKLEEERQRRSEMEWKEKAKAGTEKTLGGGKKPPQAAGKHKKLDGGDEEGEGDAGGMHPSRLARLKG